jgi:hypothetical protein
MARRVFFSFHYDWDIWRSHRVRQANVVAGPDVAGFFDHSEYDAAQRQGAAAIRSMILRHLDRTSVTVVLIGTYTAGRPWVQYEIAESIKRKNGLLGIRINHLENHRRLVSPPGHIPSVPPTIPFPVYVWDNDVQKFAARIEEAGKWSDAQKQPPPLFRPFPPRRFS